MDGGCHGSKLQGRPESSRKVGPILIYNLFLNPIGKATVYYGKMKFLYKGEVDQDGKAQGYGKAKGAHSKDIILEGTWFANKPHGLIYYCKWIIKLTLELDHKYGGGKWRESDDSDMGEMPIETDEEWAEYRSGEKYGRRTTSKSSSCQEVVLTNYVEQERSTLDNQKEVVQPDKAFYKDFKLNGPLE